MSGAGKFLILLCVLGAVKLSRAMEVGFNQAWFHNNFGIQWTEQHYDPEEVEAVLQSLADSGSTIIRVWLFEGMKSESIIWKNGLPVSLDPHFGKNFLDFMVRAKKHNVMAYLTLFTGVPDFHKQSQERKNFWYNFYNNNFSLRDQMKANVLGPLLKILSPIDVRSNIYGIDLVNEIDTMVKDDLFVNDWYGVNNFVCDLRSQIKDSAAESIPVTASLGWPKIPLLSRGATDILLDPNPHPSCVDFWDLHLYNNSGSVDRCDEIRALSQRYNKKIILGEFGQLQLYKAYDDPLQTKITRNFLNNARHCGFSAALAWRLKDNRLGHNEEARYSYISYGKPRPAYFEFIEFVKKFPSTIRALN